MESSEDKQWAQKYLLDPLNAPEPSEETGPGSHFVHRVEKHSTPKEPTATTATVPAISVYPSPPASASPTQFSFHHSNPFSPSHRQAAFGDYPKAGPSRRSLDEPIDNGKGRRRGSSLSERYPGDMSHRPLDQLRKDAKAANRAPHLRKQHFPGADTIDSLDRSVIGGAYHHEGPYDATLLSRNRSKKYSPIEAVRGSNNEALRATPREYIKDSLNKHVPLQGTSVIPPGMEGIDGRKMNYAEGADLMREADAPGGAYKRWEDVKYLPEDYKGKGEPSFSLEKALKEHDPSGHSRSVSDSTNTYEMQPQRPETGRQRSISSHNVDSLGTGKSNSLHPMKYSDYESEMRRSNTTGHRVGEGLRKRFGSIRLHKKTAKA